MLIRYEHARLFTADQTHAECFVVKDGRFVFVGSIEDARRAYPDAASVDLGGQFVCPGFNDSHMHLLELGCTLMQAQLAPHTDSLAHVLEALKSFSDDHPGELWVLGRGWNQDDFSDTSRYPNRDDLDQICPDRPMLITRACGHVAVANSAALRLCGMDTHAPSVSGGCVVTDENGRPTGVLEENAIPLVSSLVPAPGREGIKQRLLLAMSHVNRFGITSVQSDDFVSTEAPFEEVIAAYHELRAEGRMTVRVTQQCQLLSVSALERFLSLGYHSGWGDEWFRLGPLKIISDGSLGSRTALLHAPYSDALHTCGISSHDKQELDALILTAHRAGMQIAAHAIGDAAADNVLDAVERAQALYPRSNARHGIVHAQILTQAQVKRMQRLGMHAYIQSIFLDYDTTIVYQRLGSRADEAYPAASLLAHGVTLSGGSDCPVEPPNVLMGIQCAVTRRPVTRHAASAYLPHEALTLRDALLSFTSFGAYASFEEQIKGRIAPGFLADFTVLGIDPFETDPQWIHRIPVKDVYIGGRSV